MERYINITGTWAGYYYYGADYGEELHEEKVKFMLFLSQKNFKFEGTSVDYEGEISNFEKADIKGFIQNDFISFIKQYPVAILLDDDNNLITDQSKPSPEIHYTGHYNQTTKIFSGKWEMVIDRESDSLGDMEYLNTGRWEMWQEE
jgi:hypothetical protein